MADNYDILIAKINAFKQKFYLNRLLRGLIYAAAVILALFLLLFVFTYYTHPGVFLKTTLFILFVLVAALSVIYWVILPILAYFKLGKTLSTTEAARFIGSHFSNIRDKLLNTLQLHALASRSPENKALIMASIDQKISALQPIPFSGAIRLKDNRKYLKFFIAPLSVIILIWLIFPAVLREGSYSFLKFDQEILPVAPFHFELTNKRLNVTQGDDLQLEVKLTGDALPQDVYLEDGAYSYKLEKKDISNFTYTFKNLQQTKKIKFLGGGFSSKQYLIEVKPRPAVLNMDVTLQFPAYLNKPRENVKNAGDLLIPEGTKVSWTLNTENSTVLSFILGNKTTPIPVKNHFSSFSASIRDNTNYKIVAKNDFVFNKDSLSFRIAVIKDLFPLISVQEFPDSISTKALYFSGNITDDYGFSGLFFCYNILENGKKVRSFRKPVQIKAASAAAAFFYLWKIDATEIKQGETAEYYFEVLDNDGVNGAKMTRSTVSLLQSPTPQQIADKISSDGQQLKQKMENAIKLATTVEKESKKLNEAILDKKQLTYEDKKQIEQLLEKQKELEASVKEIQELNKKNNLQKEENISLKQELEEKQRQINELFNNVLDEKTKDLLKQLEKLIRESNKEQTQDQLSKMQLDNKSLKNELDRILELYKQLEYEQAFQNNLNRLKDLAAQQQELAKEKTADAGLLKKKQEALTNDFKELKSDFDKLEKKNEALERPNNFKSPDEESNKISQEQQKATESLQNNNRQKTAEHQENAANEMQKLVKKMEEMQEEGAQTQTSINAAELRKLLQNLLSTSFDQEKTMLSLRRMPPSDPQYVNHVQKQRAIKDNMASIADSLFSLSKRVPQIETTVNAEMQKINLNVEKSLESLGDRRTSEANKFQQYTLTSVNNLALMLNEALEQLQNMQKKGGSDGQGMQQLQKMQQQLNERMENARKQMEKEGNRGTVPKGSMSEEFARMAQQQQLIREALQKINREENKDGKGSLGDLNQLVKEMKQTESDLVNKRIEQETLNRQKNVLTKLLDAEKSEQERDEDAKRKATAAKEFPPSYKQMLEKFNRIQKSETEQLQKIPFNFNHYYKIKLSEYYKGLKPEL